MQDSTNGQAVFLDAVLLEKMFSNLISNAVKYSKPNTMVTITLEFAEKCLKITVKDEGIGLLKSSS